MKLWLLKNKFNSRPMVIRLLYLLFMRMTVKELIEKLKEMPEEMDVYYKDSDWCNIEPTEVVKKNIIYKTPKKEWERLYELGKRVVFII